MASSTSVDVIVRGKGGHGAMPHNTVDPIVLASFLVLDLQTIVSREIKPIDPAVVTVGSIHGGTKHNIIPSDVHLQLTLRAFKDEVRDQLIEGIKRRANGLAAAHRAPAMTVEISDGTPPTINTPSLVQKVVPFLKGAVGAANVEEVEPTMGAEDFGLFGQGGVPTFMFRLGTIPPEKVAEARAKDETLPSLHSSFYFPDPKPSIETGVRAMTAAVVGLLPPPGKASDRRAPIDDLRPTDLLTSTGTRTFFNTRMSISLVENRGKIECRIRRYRPAGMEGYVEAGPIRPLFDADSRWFVYPQADDQVWTFDGRDHLISTVFGRDHPDNVMWNQVGPDDPDNGRTLPEKFKNRLPKEFVESFQKK